MGHVPHCFVPGPWDGERLTPAEAAARHLERVLRLAPGSDLTYTDGAGTVGAGKWRPPHIDRGVEQRLPDEPRVTIAVAPPKSTERQRFLVEKLAELGVARLVWLAARYGDGRPPRPEKARAWAVGALEQSRGAWLLDIGGPVDVADLPVGAVLADRDGPSVGAGAVPDTIAIGPAGGWHPDELAIASRTISLGERILRTETAAIAAAVHALAARGA